MELITSYQYTWKEGLAETGFNPFNYTSDNNLRILASNYGFDVSNQIVQDILNDSKTNDCFFLYALPKILDEPFLNSQIESTDLTTNADAITQMRKAISFWISTYPYYSKLLSLYESEGSKLLDQVATATDNKGGLSDMPQSSTFAEFVNATTSTDRLSQLTQTHSEDKSDYGTKMQRLDEIRRNYANLMQDWADEFIKTFVIY